MLCQSGDLSHSAFRAGPCYICRSLQGVHIEVDLLAERKMNICPHVHDFDIPIYHHARVFPFAESEQLS